MSPNLSKGPLFVISNDIAAINGVLMELQNRIDELSGLRGAFAIHDDLAIQKTEHKKDAFEYTDSNGTVLHGFGKL